MFKGAVTFKHWDECCPQMAELLEDVKESAAPFSASVLNLLDVVLCGRNPTTDFHQKTCSYGDCEECGLGARLQDVSVEDEIDITRGSDIKKEAVVVHFQAYEKMEIKENMSDKKEDPKTYSRTELQRQDVSPSVFVPLFRVALDAYQEHRYIPAC